MSGGGASEKAALREHLKRALAAISPGQRVEWSTQVCGRALAAGLFAPGSTVMIYAPMAELGEVDLTGLVDGLAGLRCRICVPRVDWKTRTMAAVPVDNLSTDMIPDEAWPGRGLRTPRPDVPALPVGELDVVVVPGLGFDRAGNRLGRGAAFYDRFLGSLRPTRPARVALAFDVQVVPRVPVEPHDARVSVLVTPTQVVHCASGGQG